MKTFLVGFVAVLLIGAAAMGTYLHFHEAGSVSSSSPTAAAGNDTSSAAQRAIASMPAPTGGSGVDAGTAPPQNDWKKIDEEDAKNRAEQNWKADHVQPAQPGDSNVSDEDRRELQDSEHAESTPANHPK